MKKKEIQRKFIERESEIENLKLESSIKYYLKENNINTIEDLVSYTEQEIAMLKIEENHKSFELGYKRARKVNRELAKYNLSLKKSKEGYISEMQLNEKLYNILIAKNIHTINQLTEMTESDLLKIEGIGIGSLAKIKEELKDNGKCLKEVKKVEKNKHAEKQDAEIKILKLSNGAYNKLMRQGIDSIDKLTGYSESELLELSGIGSYTITQINQKLKRMGLEKLKK